MQLAIFGPGLIGGSIALAARQRALCSRLVVWSPDAAERARADHLAFADLVTDDAALAAAGADLAILCTPPAAMPAVARALLPSLPPGAALSDVASVKGGIARALEQIAGARYVGSHPMAGSDAAGLGAARADLFEGSVCLITPHRASAPEALERVETLWTQLGARLRRMSLAEHDDAVALISHLPHLAAAALVHFVAAQPGDPLPCAGPGWRDATRVAGGPAELWTEILSHNRAPVTRALHGAIAKLREAAEYLEEGREADLQRFLAQAQRCARPAETTEGVNT